MFKQDDIHATWATVGFLFARDPEELAALQPAVTPSYDNHRLSPYPLLRTLASRGTIDRYHYGWPLVELVSQLPTQELATHTLSHYWALEAGASTEAFEHDVEMAIRVAADRGIELRSIVFPRNQVAQECIDVLPRYGIRAYRGNLPGFMHQPSFPSRIALLPARAMRLVDTYVPLTRVSGSTVPLEKVAGVTNVAATRFLRPYDHRRRALEKLRLRRIRGEMTQAARTGGVYHLWWHPHNFGVNQPENFAVLDEILTTFRRLRDEYGFRSMSMIEAATELGGVPP
jgi:hypothetical protein